jgi:cyclopropane-fatty-acyl-phospholipid synthase
MAAQTKEKRVEGSCAGLAEVESAGLRLPARSPVSPLERWLVRRFIAAVGNPPVRIGLWDGTHVDGGSATSAPRPAIVVRDRAALWRLMTHPTLAFGEEYAEGGLHFEGDLLDLLRSVIRHRPAYLESRFLGRWSKRAHNTLSGSRSNISHHYDIGNDFYKLWLDREMAYTCAYFPDPDVTLESAQFAKMDLVCRKLNLQRGDTVVEAGCGWGGLARHMARHYGVRVKAYNISSEQVAYARQRATEERLDHMIEFIQDDYRNIRGSFDAFVSVGMLEHVGVENYVALGNVINGCLKPEGRGLIHSIGQNRAEPLGGFIEKHIFPGAYPPTLREMMRILEPNGFAVVDVENLRPHYALTLAHWLARFERNADRVREMFDERFYRAWRLYLASSQASFETNRLQLFQVVFSRLDVEFFPLTRTRLYKC